MCHGNGFTLGCSYMPNSINLNPFSPLGVGVLQTGRESMEKSWQPNPLSIQ
jgi:hypothetical protein